MDVCNGVFGYAVTLSDVHVSFVLTAVLFHHPLVVQDLFDLTNVRLRELGVTTTPVLELLVILDTSILTGAAG